MLHTLKHTSIICLTFRKISNFFNITEKLDLSPSCDKGWFSYLISRVWEIQIFKCITETLASGIKSPPDIRVSSTEVALISSTAKRCSHYSPRYPVPDFADKILFFANVQTKKVGKTHLGEEERGIKNQPLKCPQHGLFQSLSW